MGETGGHPVSHTAELRDYLICRRGSRHQSRARRHSDCRLQSATTCSPESAGSSPGEHYVESHQEGVRRIPVLARTFPAASSTSERAIAHERLPDHHQPSGREAISSSRWTPATSHPSLAPAQRASSRGSSSPSPTPSTRPAIKPPMVPDQSREEPPYMPSAVRTSPHHVAANHRLRQLRSQADAGYITNLRIRPGYPLRVEGVLLGTYYAAFEFLDTSNGRIVVEPLHPPRNAVQDLRERLFEALYGIQVARP